MTFNYRVGPLGFLSLSLPEYSGNMAIKDQLLALEWVNRNIEGFGGDKNDVTLFGHSSGEYFKRFCLEDTHRYFVGSSSVNLHILSPKSNVLFNKAIMMSGSALNPFLLRETDHLQILYNFGLSK